MIDKSWGIKTGGKRVIFLRSVLVFVFAGVSSFSYAQVLTEVVDDLVKKYERKHSFHGNVLVVENGETVYSKSVGLARVESQTPNNMDSRFMVASISKTFTAAAILKLEKEGKLSIEDPVSEYVKLPKRSEIVQEDWDKIKVKHLLNHTSGLIRDFKETAFLNRSDFNSLSDIVSRSLMSDKILVFEPGEKFYYSNFGYLLLAAVVQKASKSFFENYLKANFFFKHKLYSTDEYHRFKVIDNMSDGYFFNEDRRLRKRCCDDATALRGAASLYSTVGDLSLWLDFLSTEMYSEQETYIEKMTKDIVQADFEDQYYGFGLMIDEVEGMQRIYHNGHEWGYVSVMSIYPELNLKIIVLANRHEFIGFSGFNAADSISKDIFKEIIKLKTVL